MYDTLEAEAWTNIDTQLEAGGSRVRNPD